MPQSGQVAFQWLRFLQAPLPDASSLVGQPGTLVSRKVLHKSHVIHRPHVTITTTQCRRHVNTSDGMNIAERDEDVTCKFCLRLMRPLYMDTAEARLRFASDAEVKS